MVAGPGSSRVSVECTMCFLNQSSQLGRDEPMSGKTKKTTEFGRPSLMIPPGNERENRAAGGEFCSYP